MRHQLKQLTAAQFDAISDRLTNFEQKNLDAARRVLVGKAMQTDVAKDLGVSIGAVSAMIKRVWQVHLAYELEQGRPPNGWTMVSLALPQPMAEVVTEMARVCRERMKQ